MSGLDQARRQVSQLFEQFGKAWQGRFNKGGYRFNYRVTDDGDSVVIRLWDANDEATKSNSLTISFEHYGDEELAEDYLSMDISRQWSGPDIPLERANVRTLLAEAEKYVRRYSDMLSRHGQVASAEGLRALWAKAREPSDSLFRATVKLAKEHPELRAHLVPLLRKHAGEDPALMGQTHENGHIRFHVFQSAIRVWDLTNAGKRGKKVDRFSLYNLDFPIGGLGANQDDPEIQMLRRQVLNFPRLLLNMNYQQALKAAQGFVARGNGAPRLDQQQEMGVRVAPAGFKPFKKSTPEFEIEADDKDYTIRDKRDQANLPACYGRGKVSDTKRFFRWVQDNWDRIKGMTYNQLTSLMLDEKFDFHSYCRMD